MKNKALGKKNLIGKLKENFNLLSNQAKSVNFFDNA